MISSAKKKNLAKLADYLENLPDGYPSFDMRSFNSNSLSARIEVCSLVESKCGTVACAVGHGPDAGITAKEGELWTQYSSRVFASSDSRLWKWCFSDRWTQQDNTAKGAAARIRWALKHMWLFGDGVPSNWTAQWKGTEPLCYV